MDQPPSPSPSGACIMSSKMNRRRFMAATGAAGAALTFADASSAAAAQKANERLRVGVMGTGGRGTGSPVRSRSSRTSMSPSFATSIRAAPNALPARSPRSPAGPRRGRSPIFAASSMTKRSTSSSSPPAITGTPRPPSWLARPASMSMSKSRAATTRAKGSCWSQAARKHQETGADGQPAPQLSGVIEAIDELRKGAIGRVYLAKSWYQNNRATDRPRQGSGRYPRGSTTISGKARRRAGPSTPTTCITTGTGSGTGATANSATTAST